MNLITLFIEAATGGRRLARGHGPPVSAKRVVDRCVQLRTSLRHGHFQTPGRELASAAMLSLALGLFFLALTGAVSAAEPERADYALKLDLFSIEAGHVPGESANRKRPSYRFSAGVVLNDGRDVPASALGLGNATLGNSMGESKTSAIWATRSGWQMTPGGDRLSLSPLLRFGSQEHRIDVKPRRRSLFIQYRHDFN